MFVCMYVCNMCDGVASEIFSDFDLAAAEIFEDFYGAAGEMFRDF